MSKREYTLSEIERVYLLSFCRKIYAHKNRRILFFFVTVVISVSFNCRQESLLQYEQTRDLVVLHRLSGATVGRLAFHRGRCNAPKIGKSWLMLELALGVAKGEPMWGMETKQGAVLYYCLEDTLQRIQQACLKSHKGKHKGKQYIFPFQSRPKRNILPANVHKTKKNTVFS